LVASLDDTGSATTAPDLDPCQSIRKISQMGDYSTRREKLDLYSDIAEWHSILIFRLNVGPIDHKKADHIWRENHDMDCQWIPLGVWEGSPFCGRFVGMCRQREREGGSERERDRETERKKQRNKETKQASKQASKKERKKGQQRIIGITAS